MLAPTFCNAYEIQAIYTKDNHELVVLKFFYSEPAQKTDSPFPKFPFAPVAAIILERATLKSFLNQMNTFLAVEGEHRVGGNNGTTG